MSMSNQHKKCWHVAYKQESQARTNDHQQTRCANAQRDVTQNIVIIHKPSEKK
jgi:hypothetical protein